MFYKNQREEKDWHKALIRSRAIPFPVIFDTQEFLNQYWHLYDVQLHHPPEMETING